MIARVLGCPWQRCTVHPFATCCAIAAQASVGWSRPRCGSSTPRATSRHVSAPGRSSRTAREPCPKVAKLLAGAEEDLLAFYRFPDAHWSKLRSTNSLPRVNREIGRRSDVVNARRVGLGSWWGSWVRWSAAALAFLVMAVNTGLCKAGVAEFSRVRLAWSPEWFS